MKRILCTSFLLMLLAGNSVAQQTTPNEDLARHNFFYAGQS